ncbi:MAG: polysaccharide export protein [Cycloclasticus sp.]|nr:polysaccharide export protein [Cycloclasticus sp.]
MRKVCISIILLIALACSSAVLASDRYLLNAGDVLDISVWNEETLEKTVLVLPDGMVSFPLAGELMAKGKSVAQLEQALKKNLAEFLADPVVTVVVASVSGNTVHILGKVQTPGSFVMSQNLNVMQALSLAGGLSPYAEENNIIVLRQQGSNQAVIQVRYADIKKGDDVSTNIKLNSGDVIVIP